MWSSCPVRTKGQRTARSSDMIVGRPPAVDAVDVLRGVRVLSARGRPDLEYRYERLRLVGRFPSFSKVLCDRDHRGAPRILTAEVKMPFQQPRRRH